MLYFLFLDSLERALEPYATYIGLSRDNPFMGPGYPAITPVNILVKKGKQTKQKERIY